ncbi:unnamed protein product [Pleuronectes platessa]|uniref:Uncharacterized protein n=1 Tax=Pleuronectes platessa TaxID=8262 RepID=A0A9N7W334_PLEPL|nr:unnamed protein product [Pleuronectes platessa]
MVVNNCLLEDERMYGDALSAGRCLPCASSYHWKPWEAQACLQRQKEETPAAPGVGAAHCLAPSLPAATHCPRPLAPKSGSYIPTSPHLHTACSLQSHGPAGLVKQMPKSLALSHSDGLGPSGHMLHHNPTHQAALLPGDAD